MSRSNKRSRTVIAISLASASIGALATPLNTNIIVNGDAEASVGAANFSTVAVPFVKELAQKIEPRYSTMVEPFLVIAGNNQTSSACALRNDA